jgi:phage terminase large subunit
MPDLNIILPANGWAPRDYQRPLWRFLERGGRRALAVWHRRSGKDDIALHRFAVAMHERVGTYWHLLPEASQARKAIWDAVNPNTGLRRIDEAFPLEARETTRDNEMFLRMANGSTYQVVGSDNFNSLVGSPPIGVVFSEWALANPTAWAYLRPILAENGGWALFITTPRGKNHAERMLKLAQNTEGWFAEVLPATKTPVFSKEQLTEERAAYIGEYGEAVGLALFEQEFMCSFEAPVVGAIYAAELRNARDDQRVTRVPHDPALPVSTYWDIGVGDATAILCVQQHRGAVRLVDYIEDNGKGLDHYAMLLNQRPYNYSTHVLPHDARQRDKTSAQSYESLAKRLLRGQVRVLGATGVEEGINAVRLLFPRLEVDEVRAEKWIAAMQHYRRRVDPKSNDIRNEPVHDWASHGADATRTLAMALREEYAPREERGDIEYAGADDWMSI